MYVRLNRLRLQTETVILLWSVTAMSASARRPLTMKLASVLVGSRSKLYWLLA